MWCMYLLPFFKDERYITKDGKPLFVFYRPDTTIVSYVVALILHTSYAKKLRPEIYPIKTFFVALMHISLFTVAFYVLKDQAVMRWALMIVYFFAMLFKERNRIVEFFPQLKRKR